MNRWQAKEREAIERALLQTYGMQRDAAKLLDISPRVLCYKIKKLGIDWQKYKPRVPKPDTPGPAFTLGDLAQAIVDEAFKHMR